MIKKEWTMIIASAFALTLMIICIPQLYDNGEMINPGRALALGLVIFGNICIFADSIVTLAKSE